MLILLQQSIDITSTFHPMHHTTFTMKVMDATVIVMNTTD